MNTDTYKFKSKQIESYDTTALHPWTKELKTTYTTNSNNNRTKMKMQDFDIMASAS